MNAALPRFPRAQSSIATGLPAPHYYLTFAVAELHCAIEYLRVAEMRPLQQAETTLHPPGYARGSAALHDLPIGVLDLRLRLDAETRLIFVRAPKPDAPEGRFGLFVDRILDMAYIPPADIQPATELAGPLGGRFVRGQAGSGQSRILILDAHALAAQAEFQGSGRLSCPPDSLLGKI
jgi:chemotaxis signal transduction protein